MNEWILVSEKLPEEGQQVLCTHLSGLLPGRHVVVHYFQEGEFVYNWDFDTDFNSPTWGQDYWGEVIAWMPFPEPYQGEIE